MPVNKLITYQFKSSATLLYAKTQKKYKRKTMWPSNRAFHITTANTISNIIWQWKSIFMILS